MNLLDRYIGKTVLVAILLVLAIIVGLDAFAAILNEADDISESYTFGEAGWRVSSWDRACSRLSFRSTSS